MTQNCHGEADGGVMGADRRAARVIVGIAGGTGVGQVVARGFSPARPGRGLAVVISQDWYYKSNAGTAGLRRGPTQFRSSRTPSTPPCSPRHLDALRHGEADPRAALRLPPPTPACPPRPLAPAPVVVLEGILVLHDPRVRRAAGPRRFRRDARPTLRLDAPPAPRRRPNAVLPVRGNVAALRTFVRPMHEQFVQPSARRADHVWHSGRTSRRYPAQLAAAASGKCCDENSILTER